MKWKNKGHEFDNYFSNLKEAFHTNIYVFGAGQIGQQAGQVIDRLGILGGFIDNSSQRQGDKCMGKQILSLEDYLQEETDVAIVIGISLKQAGEVEQQLEDVQLVRDVDFFRYDEFFNKTLPILATYYWNKSFMQSAQVVLTERCTLKCKKCAHGCYNVDYTAEDMPLAEAYRSADMFFSKVELVREFTLIGGEPLLYRNLADVITYVGERYRPQMIIYSITTNGTIVPDRDVLEACKKYGVFFRISNYTKALPRLQESHKKLIAALNEYGIAYRLGVPDVTWIDYGFDYVENEYDEEHLIQTFDSCGTPCREVRGNKIYFCVQARTVSDNLRLDEGADDYLDLTQLNGENYKKELLEFNCGYSEKGYLDLCRRCHGMDAIHYPIPVAEQLNSNY